VDSIFIRFRTIPWSWSSRSTFAGGEARDLRGIESGERASVALALVEDRRPREPRLGALEREHLEQPRVVVDRHAPFLVVVREVEGLVDWHPLAALGHRPER